MTTSELASAATRQPVVKSRKRVRGMTATRRLQRGLALLLMSLGGAFYLLPLFWMATSSLKTNAEVFAYPPKWFPAVPQWGNYVTAFQLMHFLTLLKNSALITSMTMVGAMLSSSMAAYAFARLRFAGRDMWFMVVLATMMLPGYVTMIPVYVIFRHLHWINTLKPLIVPSFLGGGAFNIFLLRQYLMTIPYDLDDAARIDGCSHYRIYWNILMPLARPALGAIAIFLFIGHWNDFFGPLIYLHSQENFTLALGLYRFRGPYTVEWSYLMAGTLMVASAPLIVFFLFQRYFIEGMVMTGIKG
ncbi:MAG: carbohydrate ABC transporter permease [Anaerolineae bacterium]